MNGGKGSHTCFYNPSSKILSLLSSTESKLFQLRVHIRKYWCSNFGLQLTTHKGFFRVSNFKVRKERFDILVFESGVEKSNRAGTFWIEPGETQGLHRTDWLEGRKSFHLITAQSLDESIRTLGGNTWLR